MDIQTLLGKEILNELGFATLPKEEQDSMAERVGNIIFQAALIRALEQLEDTDLAVFEKTAADKGQEAALDFIKEKVPEIETIIAEEIKKFREHTSSFMEATRGGSEELV